MGLELGAGAAQDGESSGVILKKMNISEWVSSPRMRREDSGSRAELWPVSPFRGRRRKACVGDDTGALSGAERGAASGRQPGCFRERGVCRAPLPELGSNERPQSQAVADQEVPCTVCITKPLEAEPDFRGLK